MALRRVVVTGLGAITPLGNTTPDYWKGLINGVSGAEMITQFDAGKFRYFGTYNVFSGAMESYLVSQERQTVFIEAIGRSFLFEPWEPLHTKYSYKYLASDIDQLAEETGFEVHEHIYDSKSYFVDSIWRVQKPGNAELLARELRMTAKAG